MAKIGEVKSRKEIDSRGVWMRQNVRTGSFAEGRFKGVPMNVLRIATLAANVRGA